MSFADFGWVVSVHNQFPGRCIIRLVQVLKLTFCEATIKVFATAGDVNVVNVEKPDPHTLE